MASGTPVLASNIRGYRQVIDNKKNGYLVKRKDPKAIADGIIDILSNPELKKKMIENGLKTAEMYEWNKITKSVLDFYYKTIEKKKTSRKKIKRWL